MLYIVLKYVGKIFCRIRTVRFIALSAVQIVTDNWLWVLDTKVS
jgi:hypothetical protein